MARSRRLERQGYNVSRIVIKSVSRNFERREYRFSDAWLKKHEGTNSGNRAPDPGYRLLLTERAFQDIRQFIGWKHNLPRNQVEQGGMLAGLQYRDPRDGQLVTLVRRAFGARHAEGNPAFLTISAELWQRMDTEMERENAKHSVALSRVGWFHTHPKGLPVFMSGTDMHTQRMYFADEECYSIVLNPQRGEWKAYRGANATAANACVLTAELPAQAGLPDGEPDADAVACSQANRASDSPAKPAQKPSAMTPEQWRRLHPKAKAKRAREMRQKAKKSRKRARY